MFYPEYVDMETDGLAVAMELESRKLLDTDLPGYITNAINVMCQGPAPSTVSRPRWAEPRSKRAEIVLCRRSRGGRAR